MISSGLRAKSLRYKGLKDQAFFYRRHDMKLLKEVYLSKENLFDQILFFSKSLEKCSGLDEIFTFLLDFFLKNSGCRKGVVLFKENNSFVLKAHEGIQEELLTQIQNENLKHLEEFKNHYINALSNVFPLYINNQIIALIALDENPQSDFTAKKAFIQFVLFMSSLKIERYLLKEKISKNQKNLKTYEYFETVKRISEFFNKSESLSEGLFLISNILEKKLNISKLIILMKNEANQFVVFDSYGCREETHKLFHFDSASILRSLIMQKEGKDLLREDFPWENLLAKEDYEETKRFNFAPINDKGRTQGYFVALKNSKLSEEWEQPVYEQIAGVIAAFLAVFNEKSKNEKVFEYFESVRRVSELLNKSSDLNEGLFLISEILERKLNIHKLLILSKNDENVFSVYEGYGCREETHKKFKFESMSELRSLIMQKEGKNLKKSDYSWQDMMAPEDFSEVEKFHFAPIAYLGKTQGYLCILSTKKESENWEQPIYEQIANSIAMAWTAYSEKIKVEKVFDRFEVVRRVGELLNKSSNLAEGLFLISEILERKLGIHKLLILLRNEKNQFSVYEGYGCREETHKKFIFETTSEIRSLIMQKEGKNLRKKDYNWKELLALEDFNETERYHFAPINYLGKTQGYLSVLATTKEPENWEQPIYEMIASFTASTFARFQASGK
ncbi:MAG: hypothetical protein A2Y41_14050 [Spirochaetes bacterium GWB1_36_13]|nr:MAG: hypothetical protein A2Y41_14050 [Spirochaetes bacterium GWB1_36_13]